VFLNSKVNNSSEYEAFYSMFLAGLLKQPQTFEIAGSVAAMSDIYHFNSLGDFVSRRGLSASDDFSLGKNMWAQTGGLRGDFDLSSGSTFDGQAYFARFGMDVIQPMEGMRIGATGSVGRAETEMDTVRGEADAETDNYSLGGYLTYVTPRFYVDILSEVSWGDWDINVPEETQQNTETTTFLVSAEAGGVLWMADGVSVVPNGQLVYLNSDFDDVSFGYVDVSYEDNDALIGRAGARLQYDTPDGVDSTRVYIGASVVSEFAGDSETVLDSPTFSGGNEQVVSGGFDDVAAQLAAGADLSLGGGARLYGDASYLVGDDTEAFRKRCSQATRLTGADLEVAHGMSSSIRFAG
jgi:outer membrane autotransporter protein